MQASIDSGPGFRVGTGGATVPPPRPLPRQEPRPLHGHAGRQTLGNTGAKPTSTPRAFTSKRNSIPLLEQSIGTWNVEGLGKDMAKLPELQHYMAKFNIAVLCIQETGITIDTESVDSDYVLILSGTSKPQGEGRFYSGVGFLIAPWATKTIISYRLISDRLATLKLKVRGGILNLISAYAPHGGYDYEDRREFFDQLTQAWPAPNKHTTTIACGDFNARLYDREPGDEDIIGEFFFQSRWPRQRAYLNRDLLLETCRATSTAIANTYFEQPLENCVTYYGMEVSRTSPIGEGFAQIDMCLADHSTIGKMSNIWADRTITLASRHFLLRMLLDIEFNTTCKKHRRNKYRLDALMVDDEVAGNYSRRFCEAAVVPTSADTLDSHAKHITDAMVYAAETIKNSGREPNRPWISQATLDLLNKRDGAGNPLEAHNLTKLIKASVKRDKKKWLDLQLVGGKWNAVRALRKGPPKKPIQIRNKHGQLVDSTQRADTLADYFEKIQWKVTHADLLPSGQTNIGDTLRIYTGNFDMEELRRALRALAAGKTGGIDDIPPEFWKALLFSEEACGELLSFFQRCWDEKNIPEEWHTSVLALLHKKGDTSLPENYRPISLLAIGYKLLAWMLQKRIQNGGAENRIRSTQFGFRPGRSTSQAISIARRMFEAAETCQSPGLVAVLLDWSKAFDRIKHDTLLDALRRFGIPLDMLNMIEAIYKHRSFVLRDPVANSSERPQAAGIAQGCPLSPYLFVIVQSVMFFDVDNRMVGLHGDIQEPNYLACSDLLYADDTMLLSSDSGKLQTLLNTVIDEGARYGLDLNWDKTLCMRVHNTGTVFSPTGAPLKIVDQAVYLGGLLNVKCSAKPEVTRRIGEAKSVFKALSNCWSHANICRDRKIQLYKAIVLPKLLYNLETVWALQADRARLDSFHAQCLRRIFRIPSAYVSRISNKTVLERAQESPLSETLRDRQMKLYMKISALPEDNLLKLLTCEPGTKLPRLWGQKRKRGRPKQQWASSVYALLPEH